MSEETQEEGLFLVSGARRHLGRDKVESILREVLGIEPHNEGYISYKIATGKITSETLRTLEARGVEVRRVY